MKSHHILFLSLLTIFTMSLTGCKNQKSAESGAATVDTTALSPVKFDADSAFASVEAQCSFGERVPNSAAHRKCGDYIVSRFRNYGLEVTEQKAALKAWDGKTLDSRNIIAAYRPDLSERVIIATHWESRPWADADPDSANHHKPVMAANDGASGVAVMLELARLLGELKPNVGVDFICFDAEDYGAPYWADDKAPQDGTDWCLGSQYWSRNPHKQGYSARYGILLDMVGGTDARYCYEGVSLRFAQSVMLRVWDTAQRVGAGNVFLQQEGGYAQDDHVPMNEIAGIPTIDIIPFLDGEHTFGRTWHTVADTPANISRETLRAVGQTLLQVLAEEQ